MRHVIAALALGAVVLPAPAQAAEPPGAGAACRLTWVQHPLDPTGRRWVGYLAGGPYVVGDRTGRVTCSIQANGERHADPDAASATSLTTAGVVALPPTPTEFVAEWTDWVVLCTHVEVDGEGTYYWDPGSGQWSTDATSPCLSSVPPPPPPPPPLIEVLIEVANAFFTQVVDPTACPAFAALAPGVPPVGITPEGDVSVAGSLVWDCPPYGGG